jgi:hypothetical protein
VQAMQWLKSKGASEILVYGDSSGGTQVVQLLLWMEHKRQVCLEELNVLYFLTHCRSPLFDFPESSPILTILTILTILLRRLVRTPASRSALR